MTQLLNAAEWDRFLSRFPDAHLLQTGLWGELKSSFGWSTARLVAGEAGAQVLFRRLPLGYHLAYIPKGPPGAACARQQGLRGEDPWNPLWPALDSLCRQRRAILLKVEPDLWDEPEPRDCPDSGGENAAAIQASILPRGFRLGSHSIQPPRTLLVDLSGDEEQVLARMKQKTRYNIRLALKKGVVVRSSADLDEFHRLMVVTGGRAAFGVHSLEYYRRAYELFHPRGRCELLMAEWDGKPLAGLMVFAHGPRAWYLYGASGDEHRERMPTYLLQWEAMRWARAQGCRLYDLWGVPDETGPALEAGFEERTGGLWGVYRFKRGFGGRLRRAAGPWDRVYQPLLYTFYRWWFARRGEIS